MFLRVTTRFRVWFNLNFIFAGIKKFTKQVKTDRIIVSWKFYLKIAKFKKFASKKRKPKKN